MQVQLVEADQATQVLQPPEANILVLPEAVNEECHQGRQKPSSQGEAGWPQGIKGPLGSRQI